MQRKSHWDQIYSGKAPDKVSWYQAHLRQSLRLIEHGGINRQAAVIDVGGGVSTLVDDLLAAGFQNITVLDASAVALQITQQRLGEAAKRVTWIEADITAAVLPANRYDLWHDRAVFHFLVDPDERPVELLASGFVAAGARRPSVGSWS